MGLNFRKDGDILKKFVFIILISVFLINVIYPQQATYKVSGIIIEGNQKISRDEILKIIGIKVGDTIDDGKLEDLKKRLENTGFFLSVNVIKNSTKDGIELSFQLVETPFLIWISGIRFLGLSKVDVNTLSKSLFLPNIGWTTEKKIWDQRKAFLETGFFEDIDIQEENTESGILLNFIFKEMPIIKRLDYFGLKNVSKEKVEGIINLKVGDFISSSILDEKKKNLEESGLFSKVDYSLTEDKGYAYVSFYFVENPLISEINIYGLNNVKIDEVRNVLGIKGEIVENKIKPEEKLFYSDYLKEVWENKLLNTGYFERVDWDISDNVENVVVNLKFKENPIILAVFIEGNRNLSKENILKMLALRGREFYSDKFLEEKKSLLLNSPYFESVEVKKISSVSGVYVTFKVKENPILLEVNFEGLNLIKPESLKDYITLKIGDFINDEMIKEQIKKLEGSGFFESVNVKKDIMGDGVKLTFEFKENPQVKRISFEGLQSIPSENIKKIMQVKEGMPINYSLLRQDFENIQKYLQNIGFVFTTLKEFKFVDGELTLIFKEYIVEDIKVEIQKTTETSVLGFMAFLRRPTEENVVRREISLKIGAPFNWERVKQDLQNIYNTGVFDDVAIRLEQGSDEDKIKVIYVAKEKLTGSINFGGGYSSSSGLYGFIEYREDNFLGKAQKLSFNFLLSGGAKANYTLKFNDPWFLGSKNNFELDIYDKKSTVSVTTEEGTKSLDEERTGGSFSFYYPLGRSINLGLGFKYEDVWQTYLGATYTHTNIASVMLSVSRDTRDFILSPTQGTRSSLTIEFAGGGSASNFAKYQGEFQWHIPLTNINALTISQMKDRQVLSLKASIGLSEGDIPSTEFFTLGGANSIRGYLDNEFSGDSYVLFNLQYRMPLGSGLYGVAFLDSGGTFNLKSLSSFNDIKLYTGVGLGLRYETILIPIRLDFGYNFGQDPADPNTKWRVHFSFGDVF